MSPSCRRSCASGLPGRLPHRPTPWPVPQRFQMVATALWCNAPASRSRCRKRISPDVSKETFSRLGLSEVQTVTGPFPYHARTPKLFWDVRLSLALTGRREPNCLTSHLPARSHTAWKSDGCLGAGRPASCPSCVLQPRRDGDADLPWRAHRAACPPRVQSAVSRRPHGASSPDHPRPN
jgi:hypothetical protein